MSVQLHVPAALARRRSARYTLDRALGGPQSRSGRCEEVKILDPTGTLTSTLQPVASHNNDCTTAAPVINTIDQIQRVRN
jgi:hypothetical protein